MAVHDVISLMGQRVNPRPPCPQPPFSAQVEDGNGNILDPNELQSDPLPVWITSFRIFILVPLGCNNSPVAITPPQGTPQNSK
jgi:hypothetical protein